MWSLRNRSSPSRTGLASFRLYRADWRWEYPRLELPSGEADGSTALWAKQAAVSAREMSAAVLMVAVISLVLGFCKAVKDCTPVIQQPGSVPPLSGPRGTPVIQQPGSVPPLSGPRGTPVIQQPGSVPPLSGPRGTPVIQQPGSVPPLSGPRGKSDKRRTRERLFIVCHLRRSALKARHKLLQIQ